MAQKIAGAGRGRGKAGGRGGAVGVEPELPPVARKADGGLRRVGVEIEFGELAIETAARITADLFAGTARALGPNEWTVEGTPWGRFDIKLDSIYLHPKSDETVLAEFEAELLARLGEFARSFVPAEIVCPPIPIPELGEIDRLREALRRKGAKGTGDALHYAFAMQFNPELASLEIDFVLRQFRAFLLLEDWLRKVSGRDILRRILVFANPFPRSYARLVLDEGYAPDWGRFIDDYLFDNPTRNRDLDLLPLFAQVDPMRLARQVRDIRVKARPTFHYRIPDSRIDEPDWTIVGEWNRWVRVERLAADEEMFRKLRRAFFAFRGGRDEWADLVAALIED